ncbi:hypothetical protein MHM93_14800 [Pseudoalteromonas sp. MM17-2]|uniref:hypothetical protein n=1 Tax=Pseudoalteromonas sp. MM17-2 TaxID=2917753 RepID=UPI001EF515A0|nr:hypothetical protein [Pseudoalteromonas sp. MM17-2]MCG7545448.1 hypothetical protein [Pseudoalteromonas sp. MM17-2]
MSLSLFSNLQVDDLVIRAQMYKDILSDVSNNKVSYVQHEIKIDEVMRSDLISQRVYKMPDLDWLVDLMANREDRAQPMTVAQTIKLPSKIYVREKIKQYSEN